MKAKLKAEAPPEILSPSKYKPKEIKTMDYYLKKKILRNYIWAKDVHINLTKKSGLSEIDDIFRLNFSRVSKVCQVQIW